MKSISTNECFQINQTSVNSNMNDADSFTEPPAKRGGINRVTGINPELPH